MRRRMLIAAALLVAVAGPVSAKPKVSSDVTPGVNFSNYQTFTIVNTAPPAGMNPVAFERVKQGVGSALAAKGYTQGDSGDLSIILTMGAQNKTDIETWGVYGRRLDVWQYTEGKMAVDAFDTKTKQALWHGQAQDRINPDKANPAAIDKAVASVMAKFPAR